MSCVIELLQADANVAHHLWVLLFPIVWSSLHKDQQTALAKPIIQLLSKEHQTHQVGSTHSVHSMLTTVYLCCPKNATQMLFRE